MSDQHQPPLYVGGDVHGQLGKLLGHLRARSLIDTDYDWSGGASRLCFVGDYVNRGPSGLDIINLIRHLQEMAPEDGGSVIALLGNHDSRQLAARRFLSDPQHGPAYLRAWVENGGDETDVTSLGDDRAAWLAGLPALALIDDILFMHADSDAYLAYGGDAPTICAHVSSILHRHDTEKWTELLTRLDDRHVFDGTQPGGRERASTFLKLLGASCLIHGHTPIDKVTGQKPSEVTGPYVYNKGLCVNVDGGMYRGGPGFLHRVH